MIKTVSLAAIIAVTASASFAGSLNDAIVEQPVIAAVPAGSSGGIGLPVIIGGVVAAAAIAAILSDDDDDDTATTTLED